MGKYKFKVGDRVDYAFFPMMGQDTPGTVHDRKHNPETGTNHYSVRWDDGFREDVSEPGANWWPEGELVRWEDTTRSMPDFTPEQAQRIAAAPNRPWSPPADTEGVF